MHWEWVELECAHGMTNSITQKCLRSVAQKPNSPWQVTLTYKLESVKRTVHKLLPAETQVPYCLLAGAEPR